MAEFPALPLFTDAYLADTRHLNAQQHGAYMLLLIMAWRQPDCALPNDDKTLARWAAMDSRTWQRHKGVVLSFWRLGEDNRWRQGRLSDEREYVADVISKKVAAGKASAQKRKTRDSTYVVTARQQLAGNSEAGYQRKYVDDVDNIKTTTSPPIQLNNNNNESTYVPTECQQNGNTHTHSKDNTRKEEEKACPEPEFSLSGSSVVRPPLPPKGRSGGTDQALKRLNSRAPWFETWWVIYLRHEGKKQAIEAFGRRVTTEAIQEKAMAGARLMREKFEKDPSADMRFIPLPATWLNGERWNDELQVMPPAPRPLDRNQQRREETFQLANILGGIKT